MERLRIDAPSFPKWSWLTFALATVCGVWTAVLLTDLLALRNQLAETTRVGERVFNMSQTLRKYEVGSYQRFQKRLSGMGRGSRLHEQINPLLAKANEEVEMAEAARRRMSAAPTPAEQLVEQRAVLEHAAHAQRLLDRSLGEVKTDLSRLSEVIFDRSRWLAVLFCLLTLVVVLSAFQLRLLQSYLRHRREVEGQLHESEQRFRELFQNVSEGIYQTTPDGRILAANPALVRLLGYDDEQQLIAGTLAADHYADPGDRDRLSLQLESEGGLRNAEVRLKRRDGSLITVLENARSVRDAKGRLLHYEGTLLDITDRKEAERALREARDEALHASALKSEFLAQMSHEVRTPMNGVVGMISLLLETPLSDEQREYVQAVAQSAGDLLGLVNDLLDFSKIESGKLELLAGDFSLRGAIEQVLNLLAEAAERRRDELVCDIPAAIPDMLRGDGQRLRQVLLNLLSNGIKFTEDGRIGLTIRELETNDQGLRLRFAVADTGPGIEPGAIEHLFEPYYQGLGSRQRGGTGLGLHISRRIVELMGGVLEVESEPGRGATFYFDIWFDRAAAAEHETMPSLHGYRILAAVRREATRHVLGERLREFGAAVELFGNSAALLARLQQAGPRVDFVLADAELDDQDLSPLLEEMQSQALFDTGRVFVLIPFGKPEIVREIRVGVGGFVALPLRSAVLARMLRDHQLSLAAGTTGGAPIRRLATSLVSRGAVLIAEDNEINQRVAFGLVQKLGFDADVVGNGSEALAALSRKPYSLVLMDCQMPVMDGFEATALIRASEAAGERIPVVAMTAHALRGDRERCLQAGMDDYITKPVNVDELGAVLRRWVQGAAVVPMRQAEPAASAPEMK